MDSKECEQILNEFKKMKIEEMDLMDQAIMGMAYAQFVSRIAPIVRKYMKKNDNFEKSFSNFTKLFGSENDNE